MTSLLAWLDHDEDDRRRIREIIDAVFSETDTRDELGIGGVRDAFSQLLFPGTSTIQTRARYFLLVPWVYRRLERDRVPSARAVAKARDWEVELIKSLLRGKDTEGVLGRVAGARLLRLPSVVYWSGLGEFRIRLFPGSIADYHRSLDAYHRYSRASLRAESEELYERGRSNWDPRLPEPPDDLYQETSIRLARPEAAYLRERIAATQSRSMLSLVMTGPRLSTDFEFPWAYPHPLPAEVRTILGHAQRFSEVMHGAALLYNLLLARQGHVSGMADRFSELIDDYETRLDRWTTEMESASTRLAAWDVGQFWETVESGNPLVGARTRHFIDFWVTQVVRDPHGLTDDHTAAERIREREQQLKGRLSRFSNQHQLEIWNGAAGTGRLDFRWPTARTLVRDVQAGIADAGT
jgi:hypothetical protein